jgi:hypothetical protein
MTLPSFMQVELGWTCLHPVRLGGRGLEYSGLFYAAGDDYYYFICQQTRAFVCNDVGFKSSDQYAKYKQAYMLRYVDRSEYS